MYFATGAPLRTNECTTSASVIFYQKLNTHYIFCLGDTMFNTPYKTDTTYSTECVHAYYIVQGVRARGYPGIPRRHRPSEIWNHLFSTSHVTLGVPSQQELLQLFHVTRPLASHGVVGSTLLQAEDDATICNYSENTIHGVFYRHVNALQLHAAHR